MEPEFMCGFVAACGIFLTVAILWMFFSWLGSIQERAEMADMKADTAKSRLGSIDITLTGINASLDSKRYRIEDLERRVSKAETAISSRPDFDALIPLVERLDAMQETTHQIKVVLNDMIVELENESD